APFWFAAISFFRRSTSAASNTGRRPPFGAFSYFTGSRPWDVRRWTVLSLTDSAAHTSALFICLPGAWLDSLLSARSLPEKYCLLESYLILCRHGINRHSDRRAPPEDQRQARSPAHQGG